jgi:hypothetical protein
VEGEVALLKKNKKGEIEIDQILLAVLAVVILVIIIIIIFRYKDKLGDLFKGIINVFRFGGG